MHHIRQTSIYLLSAARVVFVFGALVSIAHSAGYTPNRPAYDTPIRSPHELTAVLSTECERARERKQPLLIEFSAPWCSDCQKLDIMKRSQVLADEIEKWPHVIVNVGEFDQHLDMLETFEIRSIARWVILKPIDCERPIDQWPRIVQRTLEPASGEERDLSPADLAKWLENLRTP